METIFLVSLTRLEFKSGAYNTVHAYLKRGIQIGPMRRHTLHFLFLISYLVFDSLHTFFFLTYPLHYLGPNISNASLLYELPSFPMTQHCRVLPFIILYLFTTKSSTCFPFFLKNSSYLGFIYPAENSLTVKNLDNTFNAYFCLAAIKRSTQIWT